MLSDGANHLESLFSGNTEKINTTPVKLKKPRRREGGTMKRESLLLIESERLCRDLTLNPPRNVSPRQKCLTRWRSRSVGGALRPLSDDSENILIKL